MPHSELITYSPQAPPINILSTRRKLPSASTSQHFVIEICRPTVSTEGSWQGSLTLSRAAVGFSPVGPEKPVSIGPDDSQDELPRFYYKGNQHFWKDHPDVICKHFSISLHKPSFWTGKQFYSHSDNENLTRRVSQNSPGQEFLDSS